MCQDMLDIVDAFTDFVTRAVEEHIDFDRDLDLDRYLHMPTVIHVSKSPLSRASLLFVCSCSALSRVPLAVDYVSCCGRRRVAY